MLTEDYIHYISSVRRFSKRTVAIYSDVLKEWCAYSGATSDEALLADLTPSRIRSYEVWLLSGRGMDRPLDERTVGLHLSVLSGLCRYLLRLGFLASNPVKLVSRPKVEKRLPEFYRDASLEQYFDRTEHSASQDELDILRSFGPFVNNRSRALQSAVEMYERRLRRLIISLLYATGMRRSELIGLDIRSLDKSRRTLRVRGKGDKMREIPVIPSVWQEILLYLQAVESMVGETRGMDEPLLVTVGGRRLYPQFVDRAVKAELGPQDGITARRSPHVLRHSLATALLDAGTDLSSIKELLGHASLAATQVYTHNSIEKLKTVYNNAHPRAKKGGSHGD